MATMHYEAVSTLNLKGVLSSVTDALNDGTPKTVHEIISWLAVPHGVLSATVEITVEEVIDALQFLAGYGHVVINQDTQKAVLTQKGYEKKYSGNFLVFLSDPVYGSSVSV